MVLLDDFEGTFHHVLLTGHRRPTQGVDVVRRQLQPPLEILPELGPSPARRVMKRF